LLYIYDKIVVDEKTEIRQKLWNNSENNDININKCKESEIFGRLYEMVKKEIVINNISGLESKLAAMFIQKASNYKSTVWIEKGERKANAKSLLGLLSLGIGKGSKIMLIAEGEDEVEALDDLENYLASGLGESV